MTKTASTTNEQRPPRVDSVELERRLQVAESALAQMHAVGELAVRSKADFIANISHELRTPLQSNIGFSELGASMAERHTGSSGHSGHSGHRGHSGDVAHAEYREMFNDICAGGHRMLSLVNALLDVASLGSLTLKSLTLAGGQATGDVGQSNFGFDGSGGGGGGGAGLGGAIFNQGSLNLLRDTLTGNAAQGGAGGDTSFGHFGFFLK